MTHELVLKILMRTLLLPLAALILSTATAGAQTETIKFTKTQLTVREAFAEIKAQTGYGTAFNGRLFDADRTVALTSAELTLDEAMKQILDGTGFSYARNSNFISITKDVREPVKEVTVAHERRPATNDAYRRSAFSDLNAAPRRRPAVEIVSQPAPASTPVADAALPDYELTSRYEPVSRYAANQGEVPRVAVKTNLLYGAVTLTPNLALEVGLGCRTSLELSGSYNGWKRSGSLESNRKLVHMILRSGIRRWTCERFIGHFFGAEAIFGRYNIGSRHIPLLFEREYRYDGIAIGGGINYGYHWMVGKRWGVEFSVGAGVLWLNYDRYDCAACDRNGVDYKKVYVGPTDAALKLVFLVK